MGISESITKAIQEIVPDAKVDLKKHADGTFVGTVVSNTFAEMTHLKRQRLVWDQIRKRLQDASASVGILLLYSPEEFESLLLEV